MVQWNDTDVARFWSKVDRTGVCHLWTAGLLTSGYGAFWVDGRQIGAHVFAYLLAHGPNSIPAGVWVRHICPEGERKDCANPAHLRLSTSRLGLARRYWMKVDKRGPNECWPWLGMTTTFGYGRIKFAGQKLLAHRVAFELANGRPPAPGMNVCHTCDWPPCQNPAHYFEGTTADNLADMKTKGRSLTGDKNPSRQHPERLARGDRNGRRLHPERYPTGENHPFRLHPEWVTLKSSGELNWNAKLTEEDVRLIRAIYARGGVSQKALAQQFNIGQASISLILARKIWKLVV